MIYLKREGAEIWAISNKPASMILRAQSWKKIRPYFKLLKINKNPSPIFGLFKLKKKRIMCKYTSTCSGPDLISN